MSINGDVIVTEDVPGAFASMVQNAFADRQQDRFTIGFGGGSTARACYEKLVDETIDWTRVNAIWGDERCVPLDHDDSNYLIAKQALFDKVEPLAAVHPMICGDKGNAYNELVKGLLPLDVVHLGMGDDGHTCSLFPDSPALDTPLDRLVVETGDDLHKHPRMTLTYGALEKTRLAIFTVMGAAKKEMFSRIQAGEDFPATRVRAERIVWLVDPPVVD